MSVKIADVLKSQDFLAGLMFTGVGLFGLYLTSEHELGTAARMGPGYFPTGVNGGLTLLGLTIMAKAFVAVSESFRGIEWRPFLFIIGATVIFALLVDRIGLLVSIGALVVLCRLAEKPFKPAEVLLLAAGLAVASIAIFYYGLALPFRILP